MARHTVELLSGRGATGYRRRRRWSHRWLPQGTALPDDIWRGRHHAFLTVAWLGVVASAAWAVGSEGLRHAVPAVSLVVLAALAATALSVAGAGGGGLTRRRGGREAASCAVMLTLMAVAALAVHLSGGLIETHFLFFIAVGAAAAYQTWAPFLTAVGFVVVHHGLLASTSEHEIFNHHAAQQHPWLWALVHGALLALAAAVGVASWRAEEVVRARLTALGARSRLVVGSIDDGVLALDAAGCVVEANPAAVRLLAPGAGSPPAGLAGRCLADLLGADAADPFALGGLHRVRGRDGACTPVALSVVRVHGDVHGDEGVRAVATVRDLSSVVRADSAERALLELTEREHAQRRDVAALLGAVRPPDLRVRGVQVAVAYEPAAHAPAGGDLYDWLELPSGEVLFVVVDAMGRGTAATRQALAVTTTVRTLAVAGCPLEELVARAGAVLEVTHPEAMATVLVAVLDPGTGRVRLAGGGHPPAVVVTAGAPGCGAGGVAREVPAEGLGIGYPQPGSFSLAETHLGPGDSLVLYTDGLLEGTRDVEAGLREVTATAAALAPVPVEEVPGRLLREVSTCSRDEDDCLAVVVRRPLLPCG